MLDEYVRYLSYMFEKYGDPSLDPDKYDLDPNSNLFNTYKDCYDAYRSDFLRPYVASRGILPRIKEYYNGDINALIDKINKTENLDSKMILFIPDEINNIEHLNKLKETYPDKEIVNIWNDELAFIDDIISSIYMIDYYKSIIDDNLSPLEKVTIAYDIVKSHYYKHNIKKESIKSRHITEMVKNNNIVCLGYTKIFNRILNEIGINAGSIDLAMKSSSEEIRHARSHVKIIDEKYDIKCVFCFDATWDSADKDRYYQFNEEYAIKSREPMENFQKADSLSSYKFFLVPFQSYESKFGSSYDETIILSNKEKLDSKTVHRLLHTDQNTNGHNVLDEHLFTRLLYNVKLAEGYSLDDIPKLIQESLYISEYGYYRIEDINNEILSITKDVNRRKC